MVRRLVAAAAVAFPLALGSVAGATYLVTRDAAGIQLRVDAQGHALVSYRERGAPKHLLVWGAINAKPPTRGRLQTAFRIDYSGGWKALGRADYPKTIEDVCRRYDGPPLPLLVKAKGNPCKAPDGSYWALQSWQRMLPNLGVPPWKPEQSVAELHISHWKGPLPEIQATLGWAWGGRFRQIVGTYTYSGKPVYGFSSTSVGAPLDTWGRNMYLDTLDSAYGKGWFRENSFLAQQFNGKFCYSLGPRPPYPGYPDVGQRQGNGTRYRITALGPGVLPIVQWEAPDPEDFDPNDPAKVAAEEENNKLVVSLGFPPTSCHS